MRKNKLICLTSLLTLPVITATSIACGGNKVDNIEMVEILNYEPKVAALPALSAEEKWIGKEEATSRYVEAVKQNPNIFVDDLLYGVRRIIESRGQSAYTTEGLHLVDASCGVNTPTFGTTKSWVVGQEDLDYPTISFRLKLHLSYESGPDLTSITKRNVIDMNFEYHNMIFTLCEDIISSGGGWNMGFFDWNSGEESLWPTIRNINSWEINYSSNISKTTIMHSAGARPDIEIHNDSHYSGTLNDATSLQEMVEESILGTGIEKLGVNFAILGELDDIDQTQNTRFFQTHYFSNIVYKPDVRECNQINGKVYSTIHYVTQLKGFQLVAPLNMSDKVNFELDDTPVTFAGDFKFTETDVSDVPRWFNLKDIGFGLVSGDTTGKLISENPIPLNGSLYPSSSIPKIFGYTIPQYILPFTINYNDGQKLSVDCMSIYDHLFVELLG